MKFFKLLREFFHLPSYKDDDGKKCCCIEDWWTGEILYECDYCKNKHKNT